MSFVLSMFVVLSFKEGPQIWQWDDEQDLLSRNQTGNPCCGKRGILHQVGKQQIFKQYVQLQVCFVSRLSRISRGTGGGFRQRSVGCPDMKVNSSGKGQGLKINMDGVWWTLDKDFAERAGSWE